MNFRCLLITLTLPVLPACGTLDSGDSDQPAVAPTERVIIQRVTEHPAGCGDLVSRYAAFAELPDERKREQISALKSRARQENNPCDLLQLALLHSAPGKLRQTDATITETLDQINLESEQLKAPDLALIKLLRNEIGQRGVIQRRVDKHAATIETQRQENQQLLQRLAELQLQLDQLKSLEEKIGSD